MAFVLVVFQVIALTAINKKRDEKYGSPALYTQAQRQAEEDKGDGASFFRYSV